MSKTPDLSNIEYSQPAVSLASGEAIDTGFIDLATADKYQLSWIASVTGLTLETQSKATEDDSALSSSFTYSSGVFFNANYPVRQRFIRFILTNNTGSSVSSVSFEVKASFGSSDKLTVTPINASIPDSTPAPITRSLGACQLSTFNSSTINLSASNLYTFTGEWERNFQSDVMVNLYADQSCTLLLQFSNDGITVHSQLTKETSVNINEFTTAVKGARHFRAVVSSDSLTTTTFDLQVQYGVFRQGNAPANLSLSLDADAINVRPTVAQDEIRIGRRSGVVGFTKFAFREGLAAADGEQVVWTSSDNTFTPMEVADTYTITYDGTGGGSTDGAGTTGALTLVITHVNSDGNPETFIHTLGTDGSDTTTQSGFGINRMAVASNGGAKTNVSDITLQDTTNSNTQAHISAGNGTTEQALFTTGSNHDAIAKWLYINVNKVSGGGNVRAIVHGYIYNRMVDTRYLIFRSLIDTSVNSIIDITDPIGFNLSPTDVIWFTVDTDTNNSEIDLRFSLNEYRRA